MNWGKIIGLALSLLASQLLLGVVEGVLSTPTSGVSAILVGHAASFIVCSAVFASFARRTPARPLFHAWLGLLLEIVAAALLLAALSPWLGSTPLLSIVPEWVVLLGALMVGTNLGINRGNKSRTADA